MKDFENIKKSELNIANTLPNEKGRNKLINRINKMKFYFDKSGLISYGKCSKTNLNISFIFNIFMPKNNKCYKIR